MYRPVSGRSAAWLARPSGGREVESSNLSGPTNKEPALAGNRRFRSFPTQPPVPGMAQAVAFSDRCISWRLGFLTVSFSGSRVRALT